MRRSILIAVIALMALPVGLPASAASCSNMAYDCTWPDTLLCNGTNSTVRTKAVPGGTLELRYDSGCRTIWGRLPTVVLDSNFSSYRYGGSGSCPWGSTFGLATQASGSVEWTRQLNDANCLGYTRVTVSNNVYVTNPGY